MKIWVCRDKATFGSFNDYQLFEEACSPILRHLTDGWNCYCECGGETHFINKFVDYSVKEYTGLKRHLKPGTKKLMTWTLPLARQPKGEK